MGSFKDMSDLNQATSGAFNRMVSEFKEFQKKVIAEVYKDVLVDANSLKSGLLEQFTLGRLKLLEEKQKVYERQIQILVDEISTLTGEKNERQKKADRKGSSGEGQGGNDNQPELPLG